jgi:poly-gamma-glutamate synthesis protein (capsule biosynthesis protein)
MAEPTATATASPVSRSPVTIAAVGDIMLGRGVAAAITENRPAAPFDRVAEPLKTADITIGNLEVVVSDGGVPEPKSYTFRTPPLAARGLAEAGFDVVALANNHSLDFGPDAMLEAESTLETAGVHPIGAGRDAADAWAPVFIERNGLRFAFISAVEVPDEAGYGMREWAADAETPGVAWIEDGHLAGAIADARSESDVVVVMLHFGLEGSTEPSPRQRAIARLAIDAGAALVVGSHPHMLQEVEEYGGGLIAYSLGNFVFDGFEGRANDTGILQVTVHPEGALEWQLVPATIGWDGLPHLDP